MTLPKALILELDGVLADDRHRRHFIDRPISYERVGDGGLKQIPNPNGKPDWDAYHAAACDDTINESVLFLIDLLPEYHPCLIVTGTPEKYRNQTEIWINDHFVFSNHDRLFMRPDWLPIAPRTNPDGSVNPGDIVIGKEGKLHRNWPDTRPSHIVKREIYDREIAGKYDVLCVLESDDASIEMYRSLGITCMKVVLP